MVCKHENTLEVDQSKFWDGENLNWEAHRIGWAIAGGCALLTVIITIFTVGKHCRSYTNPAEQRQIIRILYMPAIYAIISFLSYRFFRYYTYYSLVQVAYEAVTISAFLLLIIEYVASTASGHSAHAAIERKDKEALPLPFCCWRYRPTKAYFMYTVKWSVLQYVIIRPLCSIAGIICEHLNVLCEADGFSPRAAKVYIESVNFVSISVALYGLLLFYGLMKDELKGRRPLAKFTSIKAVVMLTFYQSFMFTALEGKVIHATQYWTESNIKNGLNALAICIEMVFFALLMAWAYTWKEYTRKPGQEPTRVWRALWDSVNFSDFAAEIAGSFRFFFAYIRGKPHTRGIISHHNSHNNNHHNTHRRKDFGEAFGLSDDVGVSDDVGGARGVYAPHPGMSASASQGITPSSSTYAFTSPNAVSSSSSPSRSTSGPGRGYPPTQTHTHAHHHVPTDSEGDADGENIHLAPYRSGRSRSGSRDFDSPNSRDSEEAYAYGGVYDAHDGYGSGGGGGGYGGGYGGGERRGGGFR